MEGKSISCEFLSNASSVGQNMLGVFLILFISIGCGFAMGIIVIPACSFFVLFLISKAFEGFDYISPYFFTFVFAFSIMLFIIWLIARAANKITEIPLPEHKTEDEDA